MKKVTTINQAEISSPGASNRKRKGIHLRDLKGIVSGPEVPVSLEEMKKSVKDAVNKASGFDDQSSEW